MNPADISERVIETFREVFPDAKNIGHATTVDDIGNWDSLNHITLILAMERKFGLKFDLFEIIDLRDVKGMVEYIASKMTK